MGAWKRRKHGKSNTRTYYSWKSMKKRCLTTTHKDYHRYGGRGVEICNKWLRFINFLEDMGERPEDTTLDRIDNNGNYEPSNCRWATQKEQNNNKCTNVRIKFYNMDLTITEWGRLLNIKPKTLWQRLNNGNWTVQRALTTPVRS